MAEPYVKCGLAVGVRRVIAGLRTGCLPLEMELGRYTLPKTPAEQRICKICDTEPETQEHFIVRCPNEQVSSIRSVLFVWLTNSNDQFISMSDFNKCKYILQAVDNVHFICKTLCIRCLLLEIICYTTKKNKL